jgi:S1-C subfamily serine protease
VTDIERWKKASVHLEGVGDTVPAETRAAQIKEMFARLQRGEVSPADIAGTSLTGLHDVRSRGTAVLIRHKDHRYLVTARHVVADDTGASGRVWNLLLRVPGLDEMLRDSREFIPRFLMNLNAGAAQSVPFLLSDKEIDLAVISLDAQDTAFADELEQAGYLPISSDYIASAPKGEGSDLLTVGYPRTTSRVTDRPLSTAAKLWASEAVSLPTLSFGRTSMLHDALSFFWADMTIYPGSSGGPVIEDDHLVGVVSSQPTLPLEGAPTVSHRVPFCRATKARFVRELLDAQGERDVAWHRITSRLT